MPQNVSKEVQRMENITYLDVDKLSDLVTQTMEKRKLEIPKAQQILKECKAELYEWLDNRSFTPIIIALKEKLSAIQDTEINYQKKKNDQLDVKQTKIVTSRMMHKITSQVMKPTSQ